MWVNFAALRLGRGEECVIAELHRQCPQAKPKTDLFSSQRSFPNEPSTLA